MLYLILFLRICFFSKEILKIALLSMRLYIMLRLRKNQLTNCFLTVSHLVAPEKNMAIRKPAIFFFFIFFTID